MRYRLAVLVTVLALAACGQHLIGKEVQSAATAAGSQKRGERSVFKLVATGEITDEAGTKLGLLTSGRSVTTLGFITLLAPNGVKATRKNSEFSSPEQAKRYFDLEIGRLSKIRSLSTKRNAKGNIIGYRAEGARESGGNASSEFVVLWTLGSDFFEVTSASLPVCRRVEQGKFSLR